jgi:hypothetical protein
LQIQLPQHSVCVNFFVLPHRAQRRTGSFLLAGLSARVSDGFLAFLAIT